MMITANMTKGNIFKKAHEMVKQFKRVFENIDYKYQFGLCLKYIINEVKSLKAELEKKEKAKQEFIKQLKNTISVLENKKLSFNFKEKIADYFCKCYPYFDSSKFSKYFLKIQ